MSASAAWGPFAAATAAVLVVLTVLARASDPPSGDSNGPAGVDRSSAGDAPSAGVDGVPTVVLLVVGVLPHVVLGAVLVAAAAAAGVPAGVLGVPGPVPVPVALPAGLALGLVLYAVDEVAASAAASLGLPPDTTLRETVAPSTRPGWALLLVVVLPASATFEELLFRGALVGALSTGFGLSPWLLVVLSSVAFAVGHGPQGAGGVLVTGVLGAALAAAFVLTGSLAVVVVAHYVVNVSEFAVHEGLDLGWGAA